MSLLLREKLAISSIFPLQKGGSRTPSNSKYLLSNSIGVLGVSASLSAISSKTSRQCKKKKRRTPTRTLCLFMCVLFYWIRGRFAARSLRDAQAPAGEMLAGTAGGRTTWPTANQAVEKWCNARAHASPSIRTTLARARALRGHAEGRRLPHTWHRPTSCRAELTYGCCDNPITPCVIILWFNNASSSYNQLQLSYYWLYVLLHNAV